jgi:RpiB/LacA/LacB family sugar-phosphate isomerase
LSNNVTSHKCDIVTLYHIDLAIFGTISFYETTGRFACGIGKSEGFQANFFINPLFFSSTPLWAHIFLNNPMIFLNESLCIAITTFPPFRNILKKRKFMRIAIGADHTGLELKEYLIACLRKKDYHILDLGTNNIDPVDYADYAKAVSKALLEGLAERGILVSCNGVGASVAASKMPGIRAGLCHDTYSAHQGVEHNDMNILVLGTCVVGKELALEIVRTFLEATFAHEEPDCRNLKMINKLESIYAYNALTRREKS